ncbi:unnamed protein product, partial [Discosporangium mesarthrocarpum]
MIEVVIPTIKVKMPILPGHMIFIQQDGPNPHMWKRALKAVQDAAGDDITLETQPANSPALNINDRGLFHHIQQLKEDVGVTSGEGLVEITMEAFIAYPRETL